MEERGGEERRREEEVVVEEEEELGKDRYASMDRQRPTLAAKFHRRSAGEKFNNGEGVGAREP